MKKIILFGGIAFSGMLLSLNATAKITSVEDYVFTQSGKSYDRSFSCENISGFRSSIPSGYTCTSVRVRNLTCYKNCHCDYSYTENNCQNGTLGGATCNKNGVIYHEKCTICTNTVTADNCSSPQGSTCTKNGVTYYETCGCNYTYKLSNCAGILAGDTCKRDGVVYYQSCQANAPCNYTWTTDNCSASKLGGNTCTKNNKTYYENCNCNYSHTASNCNPTGGDSCTKDGVTYYQSCNCNNQYNSDNCSTLAGSTCKRNNKTYYATCNDQVCNYEYYMISQTENDGSITTYSNCNGNVGGNTCQKNGYTLYETCTPCAGNYPYSYANCARPSGATCTLPDNYEPEDGNYDNVVGSMGGVPTTYYQSCDPVVSTDCNPGDWVYRIVGYYNSCSLGDHNYYPECESDGGYFHFKTLALNDVGVSGVYHYNFDQYVPLPPFVCVTPSSSLTQADLAVWNGTFYETMLSSDENYPDQFSPNIAPLTYGVEFDYYGYNLMAYGGYKLTGIYLGDGLAVDISGWPCLSGATQDGSQMSCSAFAQWFGSEGVEYGDNTIQPSSMFAIEKNQWKDSYCGSVSNQACNSSGNCYSQNDIDAISCVSGDNAGLINTLRNGERSFTYNVSQVVNYQDIRTEVEGLVYPANLCLGKNIGSVSGYSVPTNSGGYSGMVYYYVPSDDEWMSYHNPISSIAPLIAQIRNTFGDGSQYSKNNLAMPLAYGDHSLVAYWSSSCSRGAYTGSFDLPGDYCRGGNNYIRNKVYKYQYGNGYSLISGAFHMTGIQKNSTQDYTYYPPMYNISPNSKTGNNPGVPEIRTQCFINLNGYSAD